MVRLVQCCWSPWKIQPAAGPAAKFQLDVGKRGKKQKSPVSMIYLGWGYLFQKTEHSSWYLGPFSFIEWPSFDRTSARSADWRSPAGLLWDLEKQPLENGPWRVATCEDTTNKVRFNIGVHITNHFIDKCHEICKQQHNDMGLFKNRRCPNVEILAMLSGYSKMITNQFRFGH